MQVKYKSKFSNKLTYSVTLSLIISSLIPLIIYMIFSTIQISNKLSDAEKVMFQSKVDYSNQILNTKINNLNSLADDYSIWSLGHRKVLEKDTVWLKTNYSKSITTHFDVDLVAVVDKQNNILDKTNIEDSEIMKLMKEDIIKNALSDFAYNNSGLFSSGYKLFNNELYIISVKPVIPQDFSKDYAGVLILGEKIDNHFLENMKSKYSINEFVSFGNKHIFLDENKELVSTYLNKNTQNSFLDSNTTQEITGFNSRNTNIKLNCPIILNNIIIAKSPIKDISHNNIGYIYIFQSRDYMLSISHSLYKNGIIVFIITILIIILLNICLNKKIVSPIKKLRNQIDILSENNELNYVDVHGPDEIQHLASVFNNLVNNLTIHKKENANLKTISITDELTKLYTHKYFYEYLENKILSLNSSDLNNNSIILLLCDIDNLKLINNINGYEIGDTLLFEIATILKEEVNSKGMVFRYDGEEFAIILENTNMNEFNAISESHKIAEDVRLKIKRSPNIQKYAKIFPITVSIGIASYPNDSINMDELINKTHSALLFSKQNGKNQCTIYDENITSTITEANPLNDESLLNSVLALAAALDAKDIYTGGHSECVAKFSLALAEKLNLSAKDKHILSIGGLLHDCGKIGVPDEIIKKQGPLTDEEYNAMKKHTVIGSDIVRHIINTQEIFCCIRHHHERWDGNGYPDKLSGTNIPIHARIIGIADAYHAMTSDRPYRKGLSKDIAFEELRKNSGTQFSPELVEPFIEAIKALGM